MSQLEIFGIDLGTTNSCIAYVDENGKAVVIPNSEGDYTTPSVVLFDGVQRIVGKEAKAYASHSSGQVFERVKQAIGKADIRYTYERTAYSPEEISSYILRKLADDAQTYLNRPVKNVIITCPYYFGVAEREATVKAGKLAGLTVHEVINEPTAAAILYGLLQQQEEDQIAIVYDLGGGTFDVTVIAIKNGAIEVIATGGDQLGGYQWDIELMLYLENQWMTQTGLSDSPASSPEYLAEFQRKTEDAKKSLSVRQKTLVTLNYAGHQAGIEVTRDIFQKKTAHLLQKTIEITRSTMEAAMKKGIRDFNQAILVGGSTRMPQVKERLEQKFHIPVRVFDPDLAVAKGAALYGYKVRLDKEIKQKIMQQTSISETDINIEKIPYRIKDRVVQQIAVETSQNKTAIEKVASMSITNVASHSFGIVATDIRSNTQIISNIVMMNDPLPVTKTRVYRTAEASQENVEFQVMENSVNSARVEDIVLGEDVGHVILSLPPGLPQYSPIEVAFALQHDGRLHITGREPISNTIIEAEIRTTRGVSDVEFRQALVRAPRIIVS